ncbi:hypothetical protein LOK49_LG07G01764 [Camellia lanceoleosa]|uniref:Uncharacterized protein n=1 Tax=Camellia lanceoleosa TaxID=1840588 RepID=A0ACC0H2W2_9ERIC|nr:hypothetical protein LOK49_LG07G01764 [Camellia lanceoleosa]
MYSVGPDRPYGILTTYVVAGGSKDAEKRWKSKKERIVLHSVGQLSFRLRSIRRVRDPLRSLLPCSFYHLQGSDSKTGIQSDPCEKARWT